MPADVTVECDSVPAPAQPTATDNCDDAVEIVLADERIDGECADSYTLIRTWTATDNCGNSTSATQTIEVQDTTAPVLAGVPADVTVECDSVPAPAQPTATDNCDDAVEIVLADERIDGECADSYTLIRTWTATDNCGNSTSATQTIEVQDTTAPVLAGVPADVTVECDSVPAPAQPTATDNCDDAVDIAFVEQRIDGECANSYTLVRTSTATDNCGNSTSATQTIEVQDTTAPVLAGVPADVTVECDSVPAPAQPTATDNCDDAVEIVLADERIDGECADSYTLIRTWTATDNCQNSSSGTQVITVQDTTAPTLAVPAAPLTVEQTQLAGTSAAHPAIAAFLAAAAATDNCDPDVTITHDAPAVFPLGDTLVEWLAVDNCGNVTTATQTVMVVDTTAPTVTVPEDVAAEQADATGTPVAIGQATASDICDADVTITNDAPAVFPLGDTTVTWTATDDAAGTPVAIGQATASDICDVDVTITNDAPAVFPLGDTTVTWTATDDSGNSTSDTQRVTVVDTTPPAIIVHLTVEQATADGTVVPLTAAATDICDADVTVASNALPIYPLGTTTVVFVATDDSGNVTTTVTKVTVVDTTPPDLTVPDDVTVEQATADGTIVPLTATASDICDADVTITNDAPAVFPLGDTTVTWTATDSAGNSASATQTVTIVDTTAPTITAPDDVTAEQTDAAGTPVAIGQATASDICDSEVPVVNGAPVVFPLGETVVTWTATDDSGNSTSDTQRVTVVDTTPPELTAPDDVTVEQATADGTVVPLTATAADICDSDVDLVDDTLPVYPLGVTTVTFVATDDSGNVATADTVVTVLDTTSPELTVPADIEVISADPVSVAIGTAEATDICDADVTITNDAPALFPVGTTVVTWTAEDDSGNTATGTQLVTVETPAEAVADLMDDIGDLDLPGGVERSLLSSLEKVEGPLTDDNPNNDASACGKLSAFLKKVDAKEKSGKLTAEQAAQLRDGAEAIKAGLGC